MSKKKRITAKRVAMAAALKAAGLDPEKAALVIQKLAEQNFVVMVQPPYGVRREPPLRRPYGHSPGGVGAWL